MPGGLPLGLEIANGFSSDPGSFTALGLGTRLTAGISANTKGSFSQIVASTASDCCWLDVSVAFFSVVGTCCAVDIAVGSPGNEVVIASNLIAACAFNTGIMGYRYSFPCSIPAGTRIAARAQSNGASDNNIFASCQCYDGAFTMMEGASGVDSIGFNAATTFGAPVTSGAATVKGSYAQLIASTARDYMGLMLAFDGQGVSTGGTSDFVMLDISVGGSGSEQILVPNYQITYQFGWMGPGASSFLPIAIPAGVRIAARSADALNAGTVLGVTAYGVYQ